MEGYQTIRIGTCSWKYDSWRGIFYSEHVGANYLREYATHLDTVEIDQWFWSLFPQQLKLPEPSDVQAYTDAVPEDFRFTVKAPNSLTLTHYYNKNRKAPLKANPHYLSLDILDQFLDLLSPMHSKLGIVMFQFGYLSKKKIPNQVTFMEQFGEFASRLPKDFTFGIEIRNPNFINSRYFEFLQEIGMVHVFVQGYYMPMIHEIYERYRNFITGTSVIRLHGPDRAGIDHLSGKVWNQILTPREDEMRELTTILQDMQERQIDAYVNINNHYEGSAPLSIQRLRDLLEEAHISISS